MTQPEPAIDCDRDRHFFLPGPKRILSLDGGGVRGAITVAFLEKIEDILSRRAGYPIRLGDYFDLVGGTSTGALIAGALALGYRTEHIRTFYTDRARAAFKRPFWRIPIFQAKFDTFALRREIEHVIGDLNLESDRLVTGLCVVTKRMDTGSPWIVANNPRAPYWNTPSDASYLGNRHYKLANLVRASTAAPHFFDPEMLAVVEDKQQGLLADMRSAARENPRFARLVLGLIGRLGLHKPAREKEQFFNSRLDGLFVDGGVTPHNNPSLILFLMSTLSAYKMCWPTGPENLSIASLGTGTHRPRLEFEKLGFGRFPKLALHALMSLMTDAEVMVLMQMQWMGKCLNPWTINSEVGSACDDAPRGGKMFRFVRYDVKLEKEWMRENLKMQVTDADVERYRCMDDPATIPEIYEIGKRAAELQVEESHWLDPLPEWSKGPRAAPPPRGAPPEPPSRWSAIQHDLETAAKLAGRVFRPRPHQDG